MNLCFFIKIFLMVIAILFKGDKSTACGYLAPPYSITVTPSLGAAFSIALARTWIGFCFVLSSIIFRQFNTIFIFCEYFPDFQPVSILCFFPLCPGTAIKFAKNSKRFILLLANFSLILP